MHNGVYLNTIESEGNQPTQHFGTKLGALVTIGQSAGNTEHKNDLSRRSIHSLEELHSEGENEDEEQNIV